MDFDMFPGKLVYIHCQAVFHFMSRSSTSLSAAMLWLERANIARLVSIRRLNRLGLEITGSRLLALRGELTASNRVLTWSSRCKGSTDMVHVESAIGDE